MGFTLFLQYPDPAVNIIVVAIVLQIRTPKEEGQTSCTLFSTDLSERKRSLSVRVIDTE